MTSAEFEAISPGLPSHQEELLASHPGRPTPAEAVAMGVTPASGEGRGQDETVKYGGAPR